MSIKLNYQKDSLNFELELGNENGDKLVIVIRDLKEEGKVYKSIFNFDFFKKSNKYFNIFEDISEIINDFIKPSFDSDSVSIEKKKGGLKLVIKYKPKSKEETISLDVYEEEIKYSLDDFKKVFKLISTLQKENQELKDELKNLFKIKDNQSELDEKLIDDLSKIKSLIEFFQYFEKYESLKLKKINGYPYFGFGTYNDGYHTIIGFWLFIGGVGVITDKKGNYYFGIWFGLNYFPLLGFGKYTSPEIEFEGTFFFDQFKGIINYNGKKYPKSSHKIDFIWCPCIEIEKDIFWTNKYIIDCSIKDKRKITNTETKEVFTSIPSKNNPLSFPDNFDGSFEFLNLKFSGNFDTSGNGTINIIDPKNNKASLNF